MNLKVKFQKPRVKVENFETIERERESCQIIIKSF